VVTYAGAHVSDIHAALNWERPQLDTAPAHEGHGGTAPAPELVNATSIDYNSVIAAAGRAGISAPEELTLPTEPGGGIAVTEIDTPYRLTNHQRCDGGPHLDVGHQRNRLLARLLGGGHAG
jgi:hypothetical protein